jgi:hypothetical protein
LRSGLDHGPLWDLLPNGGSLRDGLRSRVAPIIPSSESKEKLTFSDSLQVIPIVVLTSLNPLGIRALTREGVISDFENGPNGTAILSRTSVETNVIFPTVLWVGVPGEGSALSGVVQGVWAFESAVGFSNLALWNLIGPHTNSGITVIS